MALFRAAALAVLVVGSGLARAGERDARPAPEEATVFGHKPVTAASALVRGSYSWLNLERELVIVGDERGSEGSPSSWRNRGGWTVRDPSVRLHGNSLVDLGASWTRENLELSLVLANVFDAEWESSEFAYESRLADEAGGVNVFDFTPGIPRSLRARVKYSF